MPNPKAVVRLPWSPTCGLPLRGPVFCCLGSFYFGVIHCLNSVYTQNVRFSKYFAPGGRAAIEDPYFYGQDAIFDNILPPGGRAAIEDPYFYEKDAIV